MSVYCKIFSGEIKDPWMGHGLDKENARAYVCAPANIYCMNRMELECFKYKEKMEADDAVCRHPGDYCKYRTSCLIHFICVEKKSDRRSTEKKDHGSQEPDDSEQ